MLVAPRGWVLAQLRTLHTRKRRPGAVGEHKAVVPLEGEPETEARCPSPRLSIPRLLNSGHVFRPLSPRRAEGPPWGGRLPSQDTEPHFLWVRDMPHFYVHRLSSAF